jgi:hypothetical protein
MTNTDKLLETLIEQVSKLTASVNDLVTIDAARAEREKAQEITNDQFKEFISQNSEPIARLKRSQLRYDKWGEKVGFIIIVALLASLGFNFK